MGIKVPEPSIAASSKKETIESKEEVLETPKMGLKEKIRKMRSKERVTELEEIMVADPTYKKKKQCDSHTKTKPGVPR